MFRSFCLRWLPALVLSLCLSPTVSALTTSRKYLGNRDMDCGTHISAQHVVASEKYFLKQKSRLISAFQLSDKSDEDGVGIAATTINVYFHVIAANRTLVGGWIPDSQINAQISVLNANYASTKFNFVLRNTTRTVNETAFRNISPAVNTQLQSEIKASLRVGSVADLNVYTAGFTEDFNGSLLGYSTYPADYKAKPRDDGVVILYSTLPGGSRTDFNGGQTLTHEAGHWFGLYHPFDGGCDGDGDYVDDTEPEDTPSRGCPVGKDTCPGGGPDPIHNFMDYSFDACMEEFTPGQAQRMQEQMAVYRGLKF